MPCLSWIRTGISPVTRQQCGITFGWKPTDNLFSPDVIHCGWLGSKHQLTNQWSDFFQCGWSLGVAGCLRDGIDERHGSDAFEGTQHGRWVKKGELGRGRGGGGLRQWELMQWGDMDQRLKVESVLPLLIMDQAFHFPEGEGATIVKVMT